MEKCTSSGHHTDHQLVHEYFHGIYREQIFQLNGIGKMYYVGLMNQDYDMALAVNMLYCIITLLSNLITDLSYGLVDPRVRIDK